MGSAWEAAVAAVVPVDEKARRAALERHDRLAKPPGALGQVEAVGAALAAMAGGGAEPPFPAPAVALLAAADHGVVASGVSAWPQAVTAAMVRTIVSGRAASSAFARQVGAELVVVDVGVADPLEDLDEGPRFRRRKVAPGTADFNVGPALTPAQVAAALDVGASLAADAVASGHRLVVVGEMGIGNTTAAAAVLAALTGRPAGDVTGAGAGEPSAGIAHKVQVVEAGVARLGPAPRPLDVLAEVGGLEIAALAGVLVGAAAARAPVLLDGVITLAAAVVAARVVPAAAGYWLAAHRPVEPGGVVALEALGLEPVLDLGLRLGEGTGALLAVPLVQAAARLLTEMATLDEVAGPR
ncbi:MAG: nicotinate-nucleotide--dimethylbenzimidazole phosphoribosyltransferase [Acidimicrobiia bacterium]|nr:nicotinate-nucleotide--dimethylbenzimidazole phosphoribosyltransferase [Acidimicrobiia bacterium]